MLAPSVHKHMSSVEDYRQRLATLQGSWDTLSLLSHLSGDGTDMGGTRQAFEALAADLVTRLAAETHRKALLALRSKAQISIDVLTRNLYERTADIGFLSTDAQIRTFAAACAVGEESLDQQRTRLQRRFRDYVTKYSVYDDVVLLSPNGAVLARLNEEHGMEPCSDALVARTIESRATYVETFATTTLFAGSARRLIYSYRVVDQGRVVGVLCLCFRFDDEIAGIFAQLRETADWTVFALLDDRGHVLASSDAWQIPVGAPIPLATQDSGSIIRFAGREYLAITRSTQGYQGYVGPGWFGQAMAPLEHAYERSDAAAAVHKETLATLRSSAAIFSDELRSIPLKADAIQRELNRAVWNGNVRLAQRSEANSAFAKVLLWEIGNAGRRTQQTFEQSTAELQETVISAILADVQQLAALAIDVLDRNFYERANDCRWWALTSDLVAHLSGGTSDLAAVTATLKHIHGLYTVYHDIVLFDSNKRIRAVANQSHEGLIGQTIAEPWVSATLALRSTQDFAVSDFSPSSLYPAGHTYVFGAAVKNDLSRTIGGVGIVFDTKPQLTAMLHDLLPSSAGSQADRPLGIFVDAEMRVIATTADHTVGSKIDLPRELLAQGRAACVSQINGTYYAIGAQRASGYREYPGLGLTAVILIPLGTGTTSIARSKRSAPRETQQRAVGTPEQMLDIATFRAAEQWLGLLRDQVVEAIDGVGIRAVPGAPPWYTGLLMYRGTPIPVVDVARFVGAERCSTSSDVVIARCAMDGPLVGLLVDEIDDIPEVAASRIIPVAELAQRGRASIMDRTVRPLQPDDPMLFIVNLQELIAQTHTLLSSCAPHPI